MKYRTADGGLLPPGQIARLDQIGARIGNTVDFPPAPEANWATAVRGKHQKAAQREISICLDPDVQTWLRAKGLDHQTEINRILRERMLAEG
jgi:uncharacterized protein (DUF4415 family)